MSVPNFYWLVNNMVAGHAEPQNTDHLIWLSKQGIKALVRMSDDPKVTSEAIKNFGFDDLHVLIPDFTAPSKSQLAGHGEFHYRSGIKW